VQTDSSVLESGQDWEQQRQQQTPSGGSVTDSMDAAYGPGGGAVSAAAGSAALNALTGAGYSADEARAMIGAFAPDEANSPALNALTEAGYSPAEAEEMVRQAHLAQLGEGWESQREQQTPSNLESQNVPDWQRYAYGSESGTTGPVTGSMDEAYGPGGGAVSSASQAGPMDAIEGGAYSRTQSTSDAGPMDPLEAGVHPAYQSPAEAGPMDAIEGGAYSSGEGESSSDDETDRTGRFGPTPR
ncbi:MAG TPA: hypothetical protein VHK06_03730, partial [Candidatus Limnocylindria bacterium]|nr:hypothetical protein [Candidatus Limnocylindria bacterium]